MYTGIDTAIQQPIVHCRKYTGFVRLLKMGSIINEIVVDVLDLTWLD